MEARTSSTRGSAPLALDWRRKGSVSAHIDGICRKEGGDKKSRVNIFEIKSVRHPPRRTHVPFLDLTCRERTGAPPQIGLEVLISASDSVQHTVHIHHIHTSRAHRRRIRGVPRQNGLERFGYIFCLLPTRHSTHTSTRQGHTDNHRVDTTAHQSTKFASPFYCIDTSCRVRDHSNTRLTFTSKKSKKSVACIHLPCLSPVFVSLQTGGESAVHLLSASKEGEPWPFFSDGRFLVSPWGKSPRKRRVFIGGVK